VGHDDGTAAGMILSDIIRGHPNAWAPAFDATRLAPGASAKEVVTENLDAAKHLVGDRLAGLPADDVEIAGSAESAPAQAVHGDLGVDSARNVAALPRSRAENPGPEKSRSCSYLPTSPALRTEVSIRRPRPRAFDARDRSAPPPGRGRAEGLSAVHGRPRLVNGHGDRGDQR
jgi:hypothetical protein